VKPRTPIQIQKSLFSLSFASLGVVFGDIGTSPLYAMKVSLQGIPIDLPDVLGVLSLIFWTLLLIISVKYLLLVFRADNDGEGGILALLALLKRTKSQQSFGFMLLVGIFGAGLMFGDGMLTPAISVLSAVEGLDVIDPHFSRGILPLSILILIALFSVQYMGTKKIGFIFGPLIFCWFLLIGFLGLKQVILNPIVLYAINPYYIIHFFHTNGTVAFRLLGGIFLVTTGGEALYGDLGHFGKTPIRLSWFFVVLPGLMLNYFGQGAYLLLHPAAIENPFYLLAPPWFVMPLLIIATIATIIASQAVISAIFSLTKQAVLLDFYPRLPIVQTSEYQKGQIYIPQINTLLALGTIVLILIFKSSDALAHAYGIAVNLVMLLTTILITYVAIKRWQWGVLRVISVFSFFILIECAFLGSNVQKISTGGWFPIGVAILCMIVMYTWHSGIEYFRHKSAGLKGSLMKTIKELQTHKFHCINDTTAIFITDIYDKSGRSFIHFLELSHALPENILIVNYTIENIPYVHIESKFKIQHLDKNIYYMTIHYGFMDFISIPQALYLAAKKELLPFVINPELLTYFIEVPNLVASLKKKTLSFFWQERLFTFLMRNYSSRLNIEFYKLPHNRTIAIGTYYTI
jgi:KUP system potassium uptake protein